MQRNIRSIAIIVFVSAFISAGFVYFQSRADATKALNDEFAYYTKLMERQLSQKWVRTSVQMGALYATERQLQDLSDDFFSKGIIHRKGEIIGGFGDLIIESIYRTDILSGAFLENGRLFYRIPLIYASHNEHGSSDGLWATFILNNDFIASEFPTISILELDGKKIHITTSLIKTIKLLYVRVIILFVLLVSFALLVFTFSRSYFRIKEKNIMNDYINHDLRTNSFNFLATTYWVKKFLNTPNSKNKKNLLEEVQDVEISYQINERIFSAGKFASKDMKEETFNLDEELEKIIRFLGFDYDTSRVIFEKTNGVEIICNLNSFTVVVLNLLKNAIREIAENPDGLVVISVMEATEYVEIFISNDGYLKNVSKIMAKGFSTYGSSGLGLSIVRGHEHFLNTSILVRWVKEKEKVICSFPIRRRVV